MTNLAVQSTEVEEGPPVISDGLPPLPDWPVLMHVGRYMALRFVCPHDDLPMENESHPYSLKAGVYSCTRGHRWERSLGEWNGYRMPIWSEDVSEAAVA